MKDLDKATDQEAALIRMMRTRVTPGMRGMMDLALVREPRDLSDLITATTPPFHHRA